MISEKLSGCGVATITPFRNGKVDYETLASVVDFQITKGVDYLVCLGTTAETATLTEEEQKQIIRLFLEVNHYRVPLVLGNFGGNNTQELVERFDRFDLTGFDAVLSVSPYYNKPSQEGIFRHYEKVTARSPLPVIAYNVPGRTASNITADTVIRMSQLPNMAGIKDASGDMVQVTRTAMGVRRGFLVLSGDDPTTLPFLACGGHGVISVIANAFPEEFTKMVRLYRDGKNAEALDIHRRFVNLHHWLYAEGNPVGIKLCMEILQLCRREVRLPLVEASETLYNQMKKELEIILI